VLQTIVATGGFYPSLLCYHYSDIVVATDRLHVTIVAYGPLLPCLFVVVKFIGFVHRLTNKITTSSLIFYVNSLISAMNF
jgi:hypothetical protein